MGVRKEMCSWRGRGRWGLVGIKHGKHRLKEPDIRRASARHRIIKEEGLSM